MPTYILLSTLTPEGRQTLHRNPERLEEVDLALDVGDVVVTPLMGAYTTVTSSRFKGIPATPIVEV